MKLHYASPLLLYLTADEETLNESGQKLILPILACVVPAVVAVFGSVLAVVVIIVKRRHYQPKGKYSPSTNYSSEDTDSNHSPKGSDTASQTTDVSSENYIDSQKETDMNSSYSAGAKQSRLMQLNNE